MFADPNLNSRWSTSADIVKHRTQWENGKQISSLKPENQFNAYNHFVTAGIDSTKSFKQLEFFRVFTDLKMIVIKNLDKD